MPLIFHWGGPRHGKVAQLRDDQLASGILVYDGPQWIGVYERTDPPRVQDTEQGPAAVWVVRE